MRAIRPNRSTADAAFTDHESTSTLNRAATEMPCSSTTTRSKPTSGVRTRNVTSGDPPTCTHCFASTGSGSVRSPQPTRAIMESNKPNHPVRPCVRQLPVLGVFMRLREYAGQRPTSMRLLYSEESNFLSHQRIRCLLSAQNRHAPLQLMGREEVAVWHSLHFHLCPQVQQVDRDR